MVSALDCVWRSFAGRCAYPFGLTSSLDAILVVVKREREEDVESYGLGSIQKLEGHLSVSDAKLGVEDW